jgi:hypothetical protein
MLLGKIDIRPRVGSGTLSKQQAPLKKAPKTARNLLSRVAPETAVGPDRRAGERGVTGNPTCGCRASGTCAMWPADRMRHSKRRDEVIPGVPCMGLRGGPFLASDILKNALCPSIPSQLRRISSLNTAHRRTEPPHSPLQPPFPRPPVFAKASTGTPVRPNGCFRDLPPKANS